MKTLASTETEERWVSADTARASEKNAPVCMIAARNKAAKAPQSPALQRTPAIANAMAAPASTAAARATARTSMPAVHLASRTSKRRRRLASISRSVPRSRSLLIPSKPSTMANSEKTTATIEVKSVAENSSRIGLPSSVS